MASMVAMAISLIWSLWRYGHSCHRRHSWSRSSIWVSKEASGPHDCILLSQLCLQNLFWGLRLKIHTDIFFLYKFWKSFAYFVAKRAVVARNKVEFCHFFNYECILLKFHDFLYLYASGAALISRHLEYNQTIWKINSLSRKIFIFTDYFFFNKYFQWYKIFDFYYYFAKIQSFNIFHVQFESLFCWVHG